MALLKGTPRGDPFRYSFMLLSVVANGVHFLFSPNACKNNSKALFYARQGRKVLTLAVLRMLTPLILCGGENVPFVNDCASIF